MSPKRQPPPLTPEEVHRILKQLEELTDQGHVVVIGGQAVYFWAFYLSSLDPNFLRGEPPTSKDFDVCGDKQTTLRAAELLKGEPHIPELDHFTPNTGVVEFQDSDGYERILDVIGEPYGLTKRDVVERALRVRYQPKGRSAVHFWVMNPIHCMFSRVHNVAGLHQRSQLALRQLRVSIQCAREFLRTILDQEDTELADRRRRVMGWNQRIYRFARSDRHARQLQRELGIDPFDAVLADDERLSERFREEGYDRWKQDLERRRRRAEKDRRRRSRQRKKNGSR